MKCSCCGEQFDAKEKTWVEIIPGNEVPICPVCNGQPEKVKKFKAAQVRKVPKALKNKAIKQAAATKAMAKKAPAKSSKKVRKKVTKK